MMKDSSTHKISYRTKYEDVYLRAYETPAALRVGLTRYFDFYNARRRHTALDRRTPDAVYFEMVTQAA